jgi:hypothetical protein
MDGEVENRHTCWGWMQDPVQFYKFLSRLPVKCSEETFGNDDLQLVLKAGLRAPLPHVSDPSRRLRLPLGQVLCKGSAIHGEKVPSTLLDLPPPPVLTFKGGGRKGGRPEAAKTPPFPSPRCQNTHSGQVTGGLLPVPERRCRCGFHAPMPFKSQDTDGDADHRKGRARWPVPLRWRPIGILERRL